jgi:hypothetical protein
LPAKSPMVGLIWANPMRIAGEFTADGVRMATTSFA